MYNLFTLQSIKIILAVTLSYTAKKTSHIPKFNGTDFIFWKKKMYIVVQVHKLDGILSGTIECPGKLLDDNNAPTINEEGLMKSGLSLSLQLSSS
jgi:hypothetical protein